MLIVPLLGPDLRRGNCTVYPTLRSRGATITPYYARELADPVHGSHTNTRTYTQSYTRYLLSEYAHRRTGWMGIRGKVALSFSLPLFPLYPTAHSDIVLRFVPPSRARVLTLH